MLGDKNLVEVTLGKHPAGVKTHAQRRHVRTKGRRRRGELGTGMPGAEFRVANRSTVTERKAKVQSLDRCSVKFIGWLIVSQPVPAVIRKPEFSGSRLPVESHTVAHAIGEYFKSAAVPIHTRNRCIYRVVLKAYVARRAYRNVKPAVRTEPDEFPPVLAVSGEGIVDHFGCEPFGQPAFNLRVA